MKDDNFGNLLISRLRLGNPLIATRSPRPSSSREIWSWHHSLIKFESFNNCQCAGFMYPVVMPVPGLSRIRIIIIICIDGSPSHKVRGWVAAGPSLSSSTAWDERFYFARNSDVNELYCSAKIVNLFVHYSAPHSDEQQQPQPPPEISFWGI